jgi:hypothetical protein
VICVAEKWCVYREVRAEFLNIIRREMTASVVWWSEFLATDPEVRAAYTIVFHSPAFDMKQRLEDWTLFPSSS